MVLYEKLHITGILRDGRKIERIISDPRGMTLQVYLNERASAFRAFTNNISIVGTYKRSIMR